MYCFILFCLFLRQSFYVAQAALEFTIQLRMTLYSCSSCFHLLSAGITCDSMLAWSILFCVFRKWATERSMELVCLDVMMFPLKITVRQGTFDFLVSPQPNPLLAAASTVVISEYGISPNIYLQQHPGPSPLPDGGSLELLC